MAKSQACITHYMEDEGFSSDEDVGMNIRQPDWMQAGSEDKEELKPSRSAPLSLPLADDVLSAGLNKIALAGPPMPEQPK